MRFILSKKEKAKADRLQTEYRKEFRKNSPLLLWAQLRALFSDRSKEQERRDTEFLEETDSNAEDHHNEV